MDKILLEIHEAKELAHHLTRVEKLVYMLGINNLIKKELLADIEKIKTILDKAKIIKKEEVNNNA